MSGRSSQLAWLVQARIATGARLQLPIRSLKCIFEAEPTLKIPALSHDLTSEQIESMFHRSR
jgi:hypothetical protein